MDSLNEQYVMETASADGAYRFNNLTQELQNNSDILCKAAVTDDAVSGQTGTGSHHNNNVTQNKLSAHKQVVDNLNLWTVRSVDRRCLCILLVLLLTTIFIILILMSLLLSQDNDLHDHDDMQIMCPSPNVPDNTTLINNATMYGQGYQAVYQCQPGFESVIEGNNIITCNETGEWVGILLECTDDDMHDHDDMLMKCASPNVPDNTRLINNATMYGQGYQAVYECQTGFEPVIEENNIIICNEDGEWDGILLECTVMPTCKEPDIPVGTDLVNPSVQYNVGYEAVFNCQHGYEALLSQHSLLVCNPMGQWQGVPLLCLVNTKYRYSFDDGLDETEFWFYSDEPEVTVEDISVSTPWGRGIYLSEKQYVAVKDSHNNSDLHLCPWSVTTCANTNSSLSVSLLTKVYDSNDQHVHIMDSPHGVSMDIDDDRMRILVHKLGEWDWGIIVQDMFVYDVWTHFVLTWSQQNGAIFYMNGSEIAADPEGYANINDKKPYQVDIGNEGFDGEMDELGYYTVELTPVQVSDMFTTYFN